MKTINVQTFLNIDLAFEIAPVGRCFGAYFIDWGIKWAYALFISSIMNLSIFENLSMFSIFIFAPFYLYSFLLEWLNKGQTVGKMILGIKVIGLDGNPPTASQCGIRWMFLLADAYLIALLTTIDPLFVSLIMFSPIVGCIIITQTPKNQRLGDIAAQTIIVQAKETEYSIYDTIYAYSVSAKREYEVVFPTVIRLSDKDMTIVKTLLEKSEIEINYELAHKLASHIKKVLSIESSLDDYQFLKKLLEDYNYLSLT